MIRSTKALSDKKVTALVVDDEIDIRELLLDMLREEGIDARSAADGINAIKTLHEGIYDLIITDVKMPGADGIEVLKRAKEINADIQVILITGYGSLETAIEAIKRGAYDYITKPFKLDEIRIAVKKACEKIRLMQENKILIENLKEVSQELDALRQNWISAKCQSLDTKRLDEGTKKEAPSDISDSLNELSTNFMPLHFQRRRADRGFILIELEKLGHLLEKGILNIDEFIKCKEKLLARF